ncbi:D-erythronate dehydrogenase [Asaia sp. VD9]|uniref:D-erythronate dehydrogenase n=1 Tax=Asaia sp. VD9 TaxID=3081235 RepID=UPI0030189C31
MHVLILGAAGMLGRKLTESFIGRPDGLFPGPSILTLADVTAPEVPLGFAGTVSCVAADLAAPDAAAQLLAQRPDIIFHLAAVVSGAAETDMALGYRVNLDASRALFEAIRELHEQEGYKPRLVFASSIGVFGRPLPDVIPDSQIPTPESSYGVQKAMVELLLTDYSRRGIFDGVAPRIPTICVRPGAPNAAASGFFSTIIREPLIGREAILPVPRDTRHWLASPRAAVKALRHAAELDYALISPRPVFTLPALSVTVEEQIEALRRVAGNRAVSLIREVPDAFVQHFVSSWPKAFDTHRALSLGFEPDASFEAIIRAHIEDEFDGCVDGAPLSSASTPGSASMSRVWASAHDNAPLARHIDKRSNAMPWTAKTWPIAAAMIQYPPLLPDGTSVQDQSAEGWARTLLDVSRAGFTELDPTDCWLRLADLSKPRQREFLSVCGDLGLSIPAISTSRRSVIDPDPDKADAALSYIHRVIDTAAEIGAREIAVGFATALTEPQRKALWFWTAQGHQDPDDPAVWKKAVTRIRELADHAQSVGVTLSLEMYEDTYLGSADSSVKFVRDVDHPACGINADIGNLVRLHRPMERWQDMMKKLAPYLRYWHVKNYLRTEDETTGMIVTAPAPMEQGVISYRAAINMALEHGYASPFLVEHYGGDGLSVAAQNRDYIRRILPQ